MLSVKEAKDLMKNTLVEQIDALIEHHAVHGYSTFQIATGKYEKQILDKVLKDFENQGWKIDRSISGFITFSW